MRRKKSGRVVAAGKIISLRQSQNTSITLETQGYFASIRHENKHRVKKKSLFMGFQNALNYERLEELNVNKGITIYLFW